MDDQKIIDLYWAREERAVQETERKYGVYCRAIAWNILRDRSDTEECVNDTWMKTWNSLPPQRPAVFSAYLGTITRNLSLNRVRLASARKRSAEDLVLSYDELQESVPDGCSVEKQVDARELGRVIDRFLRTQPQKNSCIFLRRYWYMDSHRQIASRYHMSVSAVKSNLHRTRQKLKVYLQQEGYTV